MGLFIEVDKKRLDTVLAQAVGGWEDCGGCPAEGKCEEGATCFQSLYRFLRVGQKAPTVVYVITRIDKDTWEDKIIDIFATENAMLEKYEELEAMNDGFEYVPEMWTLKD